MKSAGGIEPFAEAEELERRHRFQDVELRHHHFQDREDALQGVLRTMRFVRFQKLDDAIQFVQQLLEPELVHLVDDDEQRLVMFGPCGAWLLQRQQLVDLQITGVRRGVRLVRHDLRPSKSIGTAWGCRR